MTWREKLHPLVAKAELEVLLGLEERKLTTGMFRDTEIMLEATIPDFYWPTKGLAVYLDGPHHESETQRLKDELIDEKLRRMGLRSLRIPYKPPLSKTRLNEILDQIQEALEL